MIRTDGRQKRGVWAGSQDPQRKRGGWIRGANNKEEL